MKFRLFLVALTLISVAPTKILSQSAQVPPDLDKLIYLDSSFVETKEENLVYIRVVEGYYSERPNYVFKDYYKSENLKMVGFSPNKNKLEEQGQFIYYYENGNKQSTVYYSNGKKKGKEFNWYENGNPKSELEYSTDNQEKINTKVISYWNEKREQKVIAGNGEYKTQDDTFEEYGPIKNGLYDQTWKGRKLNDKFTFIENYKEGQLISGTSKDTINNKEFHYKKFETSASPKGGLDNFYGYLQRAIDLPLNSQNTSGKIYINFTVNEEGSLVDPKIL